MEAPYASAERDQGPTIRIRGFVFTLSDRICAQIWRIFGERSVLDRFFRYQQVQTRTNPYMHH
jgi:hypothetical protein